MTIADRIAVYITYIRDLIDRYYRDTWLEEWAVGLYHGMISHPAYEKIELEAQDAEDMFLVACFPDALGIPSPVSYYTAEFLPYLQDEFEGWERRMWERESVFEAKGRHHHHF